MVYLKAFHSDFRNNIQTSHPSIIMFGKDDISPSRDVFLTFKVAGYTFREINSSCFNVCFPSTTVNSGCLKVENHPKFLITQSKFSGPRKFTMRYQNIELKGA